MYTKPETWYTHCYANLQLVAIMLLCKKPEKQYYANLP